MNSDYPLNSNANKIRSINTLDDLITILNQVRDKVGGNVKVMGADDVRSARYEDDCGSIEDVMMCGMQSMMNKHDSEDTRVVIIFWYRRGKVILLSSFSFISILTILLRLWYY